MRSLLAVLFLAHACAGQRQAAPQCATFDGGINMCRYQRHETLIGRLQELERRFPSLATVGTIGRSAEGRQLAYIRVSANASAGRDLLEPMFKYVGNMHGDETLGRQLLLYLAQYLLQNYGRDERVTRLLDTTDIFLMPSLNPDGFARSKEAAGCGNRNGGGLFDFLGRSGPTGRENARNVDLNRDFPKQFDERQDVPFSELSAGRQPETVAMMRWVMTEPFVLSANLHAGAVVASYPFDDSPRHRSGLYSSSPDDDVFRFVSSVYARAHPFMARAGGHCGERAFEGGITNGAEWYDVPGGMQDFNYVHSNDFEITLELSCCKHVPASELTQEWLNNKEPMLKYLESTHMGIKGLVVDAETGRPVPGARVAVQGIKKTVRGTDRGEYWRLLVPGTYQVTAHAPGYAPTAPETVQVGGEWPPRAAVKHFELTKSDGPRRTRKDKKSGRRRQPQQQARTAPAAAVRPQQTLNQTPFVGPAVPGAFTQNNFGLVGKK